MIDPTIVVAIVKASGGVIDKLLDIAGKSDPPLKAKQTIDKTYDRLSNLVTTNCVRVLIALRRAGGKQSPGMVLSVVEPMRQRQEPTSKMFENDLEYRLRFLCLLGLVKPTLGEYAITQLGVASLNKAAGDTINYTPAFFV